MTQTGHAPAVYAFVGEAFQREQAAEQTIQALCARTELGAHTLEGQTLTRAALQEALFSPSLFEPGRWVRVRHADEADAEALLAALAKRLPDDVYLLLEFDRLDKRGKLFKWLKAHADLREFAPLNRNTLPGQVKALLQARGVRLTAEAFQYVVTTVPHDLLHVEHEVHKLALYAGGEELGLADVQGLLFGGQQANVFQCLDELGQRQPRALAQLERLLAGGEEPTRLFFLLAGHVRGLLAIKSLQEEGLPPPEIARRSGQAPWMVQRRLPQARRWRLDELADALHELHRTDLAIKRGREAPDAALVRLTLAWTGLLAPAGAPAGG